MIFESVIAAAARHPRPDILFTYGTAGFRTRADVLDSVLCRVGMLAVLRSKSHLGKVVGVMVTASHNPEADNGVKLCEPMGDMLAAKWEKYAISIANSNDIVTCINDIVKEEKIDMLQSAKVVVARDTRPSGEALVSSLIDGVKAFQAEITDFGLMSTPQLHYVTRCLNTQGTPACYGTPSAEGYYIKLSDAYKKIVESFPRPPSIKVDCANGIGAICLQKLASYLKNELNIELANHDVMSRGKLNFECGADYVKLYQKAPLGMKLLNNERSCSLDGDADRIVFYYQNEGNCQFKLVGTFKLLDGDKIATLAAAAIMKLIKISKITMDGNKPLSIGLIQTAYANGSSTSHVKDILKVPVVFTCTGVKYLHHEAEKFDIGVYFEANGHGTVLFSKNAIKAFDTFEAMSTEGIKAVQTLKELSNLINQTVGDALSDLLLVQCILTITSKSFNEWDKEYTDLPSRQEKVKVSDRNLFVPINADQQLSEPKDLQTKIDSIVALYQSGRCFVRPSGTEDVVRVYAEALTREETDELAFKVCGLVFDHYGGVGVRPGTYL